MSEENCGGKKPTRTFKDWYLDKGKELNKRRKARYKTDPSYRKKVLAVQRASRARTRRIASSGKAQLQLEASGHGARPTQAVCVEIQGSPVRLLSMMEVVKQVGVTRVTLGRWIKKGFLPEYWMIDDKGKRLFPVHYVEFISELVEWRARQRNAKNRYRYSWHLARAIELMRDRWVTRCEKNGWPTLEELRRLKTFLIEEDGDGEEDTTSYCRADCT